MKNKECKIYIDGPQDWLQLYERADVGWVQYSRNGSMRPCTSEQVLSHLLPLLTGKSKLRVRVERKTIRRRKKAK